MPWIPPTKEEIDQILSGGEIPERFIMQARERKAKQDACDHGRWTFKQYGRCCPDCYIFMVDFGD